MFRSHGEPAAAGLHLRIIETGDEPGPIESNRAQQTQDKREGDSASADAECSSQMQTQEPEVDIANRLNGQSSRMRPDLMPIRTSSTTEWASSLLIRLDR